MLDRWAAGCALLYAVTPHRQHQRPQQTQPSIGLAHAPKYTPPTLGPKPLIRPKNRYQNRKTFMFRELPPGTSWEGLPEAPGSS